MPEYQQFITIDFWQLLFTWCNLLILYLLVKKLLFKPVQKMLEQRKQEIDKLYQDAESSKTEAESLRVQYEESLAGAKQQAESIVKESYQKAQDRSEKIVGEAQQKAQSLLEKAEKDIEREKKRALGEVKSQISDIAVQIAAKVVERDITAEDHERLIGEFIDSEGDASWRV